MMEDLRQYILSVVCAGILCAILSAVTGKKHASSVIIQLLSGLFLSITVVSPLVHLSFDGIMDSWEDVQLDSMAVVREGEDDAAAAKAEIIKENTQAYILDKAAALGVQIEAQVTVNDSLVPESVCVSGNLSPYVKQQLQQTIFRELGIPREMQTWKR